MSIKVWEYLEEYADEREQILAAVDKVFSSGTLVLGDCVRSFETEFAEFCNACDAVGVDNATNGLFLALKALNIGPGDEVITVSNTAVPTVSAIQKAGATTKFVDIEPSSLLMDVSQLEKAISSNTKAVIPVHLFGQCVDMSALIEICRSKKIHIIEDCSQSHGASHKGQRCGSMGDLGVFSFYPTKPLGGFGDGGMVTCNSQFLADRLRALRFYGMKGIYYAEEQGYNSRLDEVHAEILRFKLSRFWTYIDRRRKIAERYDKYLAGTNLILPRIEANNSHVYYVYVVRHVNRDQILEELKKRNIYLNISYPWPIHLMRGYAHLGGKIGDLPVTEKASKEIFSLPMYPKFNEENQKTVCNTLRELVDIGS